MEDETVMDQFTGRDLIIYILQNNLEDKPIATENSLLGFINIAEYAARNNMGISTAVAMFHLGKIPGFMIGSSIFVYEGGIKWIKL